MSVSSVLFGSCRERYLRPLDPNVEEEKYSFLGGSLSVGDMTINTPWRSADTESPFNMLPGSKITVVDQYGYNYLSMLGKSNLVWRQANTGIVNELYCRVQFKLPINMSSTWNINPYILYVMAPDGDTDSPIVTLKCQPSSLESQSGNITSPVNWIFTVEWKDVSGESKSLQVTVPAEFVKKDLVTSNRNSIYDVKFFAPKGKPASLSINKVASMVNVVVTENTGTTATRGVYAGMNNLVMILNSTSPTIGTEQRPGYIRVGVGNRV